eukprot:6082465-Amphidinium_carterae.3
MSSLDSGPSIAEPYESRSAGQDVDLVGKRFAEGTFASGRTASHFDDLPREGSLALRPSKVWEADG